jgi:chromate reductase, NAD(P)H dehydrogenase (quinone)
MGCEMVLTDPRMTTTILAISGSLQSGSSNTALVRLATGLSDGRVKVSVFDTLTELPYFNPDLDGADPPRSVLDLRARVGAADALLIASPEYAHEMPGVLKNALDWLVRSGELYGKSVALLCAAPSAQRGTYVREALQHTLETQGAHVVFSATIPIPPPSQRSTEMPSEATTTVSSALDALVSAATALLPC